MTAVDRMLDALREEARKALENKEDIDARHGVLDEALSDLAGYRDPKIVEIRLRAKSAASARALNIIRKARESK